MFLRPTTRVCHGYASVTVKDEKEFTQHKPEGFIEGQVIVQLYKPDNKKTEKGQRIFNVVAEKIVDKSGDLVFDFLHEGKYRLRAILDENRNGIWDPGLYLKGKQAEVVRYLPTEISIKQNFDIEQTFDLKSSYIGGELKEEKDTKKKK